MRKLALVVLALLAGIVAGVAGTTWWLAQPPGGDASDARIVVTADGDWYGQGDRPGGCSVFPVEVYNAGDHPVDVSRILASVTRDSSLTCQPEVGPVRIPPHATRTVRGVVGFRCEDQPAEPRFTAMTGPEESTPVSGTIDMPPIDHRTVCPEGWRPAWYRSEPHEPTGTGPMARLPVTLVFSSGERGTKLASLGLRNTEAFALDPPRLPIDLSSLAPGAAPPEVYVEVSLTVRDCERARAFETSDLTLTATFEPEGELITDVIADRAVVRQLIRLVDAAC
jgi:hypothetical protein